MKRKKISNATDYFLNQTLVSLLTFVIAKHSLQFKNYTHANASSIQQIYLHWQAAWGSLRLIKCEQPALFKLHVV